jgi:hypothetical protein
MLHPEREAEPSAASEAPWAVPCGADHGLLHGERPSLRDDQSQTIIFFCCMFAGFLEFLIYPPYSISNIPFTGSTLAIPLIVLVLLHLGLAVGYVLSAVFEHASFRTALSLSFVYHGSIPIVLLIGAAASSCRRAIRIRLDLPSVRASGCSLTSCAACLAGTCA